MIVTEITKIGDPQVVPYDGKYYCYATNSNHFSHGFDVYVSSDLVNYERVELCFKAEDYWGKSHFWAPEVIYHNGKFVMHYSAMSRELNSLRIGVATSDSPTGPFVDVHNAPMFDFGYAAIDGSVLVCDEGNFLYYSKDCSENIQDGVHISEIYCVRLNDDLTRVVGEPVLVTRPTEPYELLSLNVGKTPTLWNEGPTVIYHDGKYVMNYSANCYATNDYAICVATASSPTGPFVKSKNNPVLTKRESLFGAGHNAFFKTFDGELYTSIHVQTNPAAPSGDRKIVIGKVVFGEKDGDFFEDIV